MRRRRSTKPIPYQVRSRWESSQLFHNGDEFFSALESAIDCAHERIDFESYTFANDRIGERVCAALARAVARGVRVRLIVDGIGSSSWTAAVRVWAKQAKVQFKVFHQPPWERLWRSRKAGPRRARLREVLRRLNNRNHRKVCIIDGRTAFVGSMNVIDYHVPSIAGAGTWRDTGVVVVGQEVQVLTRSFEWIWYGALRRMALRLRGKGKRLKSSELVRLNTQRRQRQENYLELLARIVGARRRVWITNAYFVPDGSLLRALAAAAGAGADVRILVPKFSDVWFIPWVTSALHLGLLRAGVQVFEYTGAVLHAKTMVIDDWALVGSSNLNHRSLLHDLEADVVLPDEKDRASLERQFTIDLESAQAVTLRSWQQRPWLERVVGRGFLFFKYLL